MWKRLEMTLENIKGLLQPIFEKYKDKVIFAYLFGTAADGEMNPLSDIDIAVLLSEKRVSYLDLKHCILTSVGF